jgi:hypothetical protein
MPVKREAKLMKKPLEEHVHSTYFTLRLGIAIIAIAFPLLLYFVGKFYAGLPLQDSMSAYYHAAADGKSMRDWFVGILFAVGVFLYLYKGYSDKENFALNIAGVMALGIAIFPMQWKCEPNCAQYSIHGVCAIIFFICIAFVCVRCSRDTLSLLQDDKKRAHFRNLYRTLAVFMLLSPAIALALNLFFQRYGSLVFFVEAVGIFAFAAYWLTKGRELAASQAEVRALRGELAAGADGALGPAAAPKR